MNEFAHPRPVGTASARFSAAEFAQMSAIGAFDAMKMELVDGELQRMNPPMSGHAGRQAALVAQLWSVFHARSKAVVGEVGIQLDTDTIVGCDAAVLGFPVPGNRLLTPADLLLVVEIAETTIDRDTGLKRRRYAEAGIAHYWVVDGSRGVVHIYGEPIDGDYADIATVRSGAPLAVPGTSATITL